MWTTLRDPRTAHSGSYHANTVASLMRAVARRVPGVTGAMARGNVSVRLTGSLLDEDPMTPEVAWIGEDGVRTIAGPEHVALLAKIREAHGLTDPTGRTLVIESWEASPDASGRRRDVDGEGQDAPSDEAMLAEFEAEQAA